MNYEDIDVTRIGIHDDFEYAGKVFHGLEDLQKYSFEDYNKKDRMKDSPYVVQVSERYPCFDSEDYWNEHRYYQTFYFTTNKTKAKEICEDEKKNRYSRRYPILEPAFSMSKIEERHLPYIYYHGEGDRLEIVQDRNAPDDEKIIISKRRSSNSRNSVFDPYEGPDPTVCLYGPPTDYVEPIDWLLDDILKEDEEDNN